MCLYTHVYLFIYTYIHIYLYIPLKSLEMIKAIAQSGCKQTNVYTNLIHKNININI
jgi:hypothetical protein